MAFGESVEHWLVLLREKLVEEHECIVSGLAKENQQLRYALQSKGVEKPAGPAPGPLRVVPETCSAEAVGLEWPALSRALQVVDSAADGILPFDAAVPQASAGNHLMDALILQSFSDSNMQLEDSNHTENNNNCGGTSDLDQLAEVSTCSAFGGGKTSTRPSWKAKTTRGEEVEWLFPDVAEELSQHRTFELNRSRSLNRSRTLATVCPHCGNVYMGDSEFCRKCGIKRAEEGRNSKDLWDVRPAWSRTPSSRGLSIGSVVLGSEVLMGMGERPSVSGRSLRRNNTVQMLSKSSSFEQYMLDPSSKKRFVWDCVASFFIIYDTLTLPLTWSFGWKFHDNTADTLAMWMLVVFFSLDIPLTCMTGFYEEGRLIMEPSKVLWHYAKGFMALDCLAVAPEWISIVLKPAFDESGYFRISKSIRMLRILRTLKLIRLARLNRFAHDIIASISSEYWASFLKIAKLSAILLLISHYAACGWFAVGWQPEGWVEDDLKESDFWKQYLVSMEWSLNNYGGGGDDTDPTTILELVYSCCIAFTSILCESYLVSSLTNAMSQVARFHGQTMQRRWLIYQYLTDHKISKPLQVRVRKFLTEHSTTPVTQRVVDFAEVFAIMPQYLLMEINTEVIMPLLRRNLFLTNAATNWPHVVPKLCQDTMSQKHLVEEESLFTVDQECHYLSFLLCGTLRYEYNPEVCEDAIYQRWYSEVAMYLAFVHRGTMWCASVADFVLLHLQSFEKIIMQHPALHREMSDAATSFKTWVRNRPESHGPLTDLSRAAHRTNTGTLEDLMLPVNPSLRLIRAHVSNNGRRSSLTPPDPANGQYEL